MKSKLTLLVLSLFAFVSCGTGTVISFGEEGVEVLPPNQSIIIPTKPIGRSSK